MGTVTLTYTLCGIGCTLRGFATGVNAVYAASAMMAVGGASSDVMVLALLMSRASDKVRPAVVSAFLTQSKVLSLLAKSLYPLWNQFVLHTLGVTDELLRFRIVMATCTVPCIAGFLALFTQCVTADQLDPPAVKSTENSHSQDDEERKGLFGFIALAVVLFVQGLAKCYIDMLVPLFVHRAFGWGASEYAVNLKSNRTPPEFLSITGDVILVFSRCDRCSVIAASCQQGSWTVHSSNHLLPARCGLLRSGFRRVCRVIIWPCAHGRHAQCVDRHARPLCPFYCS